jgi:DNA-directed RNA polymerase subunit RPC12/RpoP
MKHIIAGCGRKVYEEDNWVCPYFARPEEWKQERPQYGPCGIDLQVGTNKCLHAIFEMEGKMDFTCNHCGFEFFTEEGYDANEDKIICPNCGKEM